MIDVERTPNHKRPKDALFLRRLESGSMGRWTWGICVVVGMLLFASRELHGQQMLIPDTVIQASQAELAAAPGGSPSPTSADQFTDQREAIDSHLPPLDASATPNPASQTSGTVSDAFPADGSSRQDEKPGYAPELSAASDEPIANIANQVKDWLPMDRLQSSVQLVASMTLLGVVPALLLMTTSYVRIAVVLALLRQAFGVPNLLPVQVTTALAFFCTGWVMWPTWQLVHEKAVMPLMAGQVSAGPSELWREGISPIRQFMICQIEANHNSDDVHLFLQRTISKDAYPKSYEEVPLPALLPAFLISELKTAFIIGFQIYLPFLVIDLVVSAVTTSMGMFLLPPAMMSMPLKLLLFVLVDGWHLLIEMLLKSFQ